MTFHACRPGERQVPIGRPVANTRVHVLEPEGQEAPVGVAGELCLGGVQVGRGYVGRPELTAERFVPDPFGPPGSRLYRTGDLARWSAAGEVEYLGRLDHQVKIRGFRIELGEIESALRAVPGVESAVVLARGDGVERRLAAYLVCGAGNAPPAEALRGTLRERLPDSMVPAAFAFLERLPLLPNGKIDRRALARIEPSIEGREGFASPRTPVEEELARIWSQVLGRERAGLGESFFDLGGHSLLATRMVSRVRETFGVELPLRTIFEMPTVEGLARRIEEALREGSGVATPPLRPVPRQEDLPLSFAQERLWFLDQLEPGNPAYNISAALRLRGSLDVAALARSFAEIVRRHEALRTTFPEIAGAPRQVVAPAAGPLLPVIDLGGLPAAALAAEAFRLAGQEALRPFDLARGPLLRTSLLRRGEEEWTALLGVHHIVSDGWSLGVLVRELSALYAAFRRGDLSPLPELPVQYADYAVWQRQWLQGEALEVQLAWWREELAGAPTLLELPADRPRPPVQTYRGGTAGVLLDRPLAGALADLARREGTTLFMVLLAGLQALLSRYSGEEDLLVGTPIAGRTRAEVEGLIGLFLNTLVLRGRLGGAPSFRALLARVRAAALGSYAHQELPFERLVDELGVERSLSHSPLFQVLLVLQNAPVEPLELPGLHLAPEDVPSATAKFDLSVTLSEAGGRIAGVLEYAADLFDAATARRMVNHYRTLLEAAATDPDGRVPDLPLLSAAERWQILEWNATDAARPSVCLFDLVRAQAERTPGAPAVVQGDRSLTYGELARRAGALAAHLRSMGIGPEARVGLAVERTPGMLVGLLGISAAGGAYVPLDPAHPRERLGLVLEDAAPAVLVTQPGGAAVLPGHGARIVLLDDDGLGDWSPLAEPPAGPVDPGNLAYVLYTSGSTGRPKGVQIPHGALVNFLLSMQREPGLAAGDTLLAVTTLSFDIAGLELLLPLLTGARVALADREETADAERLMARLAASGATVMQATPATWRLLLDAGWPGDPGLAALCGGEALPGELAARLLPRIQSLWNLYGPTETTIWSAAARVVAADPAAPGLPIGPPIANTQLRIVDRGLQPVPAGVPGELCIGGAGLARGYLGRPDLTAERFVP
ncbi:MAG TPA: amino acid adenylation domain-containing protein, partial [Thermoanaerobaculia bacterium]